MLQRQQSRHILNSIPTVIYDLAITAKGFPTQWVSDSVKRILGYGFWTNITERKQAEERAAQASRLDIGD
jgi:hypothetical protein